MSSVISDVQESSCQALVYKVLQRGAENEQSLGMTLALVAAHPGAGTTYLTTMMSRLIETSSMPGSVHAITSRPMSNSVLEPSQDDATKRSREIPVTGPHARPSLQASLIERLRQRFAYVLIDCPSLKEGADILNLATMVDGVILVIEAERTRKSQVAYLERAIEDVNGRIFGHLLNKRKYHVPAWLYDRVERWGI